MTIHLPEHLESSIREAVEGGEYASVDEAMAEAARLLLDRLKRPAPAPTTPDPSRKPIWERILERTAAIPDEEWDKLPTDLAEQHDHYLYGTPKRPTA